MAHKLSRKQPKEPFWRDVLRRWQQSGLTIRAFCRQRQLSEHAFYFWRRTLAERDRTSVAATPPVTFVPLTVRPETMAAEAVVEVVLTNGRRLRLPVGVGASVVRELLAVLEETPC